MVKKNRPRTPVSQETFDLVFRKLKEHPLSPQMLGIRKGEKPNEVVFQTAQGDLVCKIMQSPTFICIELPSGRTTGIPKEEFGQELCK